MSYVDRTQTLVLGQSHGGWTTLAYGAAKADPSVKGLVNFAGQTAWLCESILLFSWAKHVLADGRRLYRAHLFSDG